MLSARVGFCTCTPGSQCISSSDRLLQVLTYTEAIELLLKPEHAAAGKFEKTPYWGIDLGSEHERYITEQVGLRSNYIVLA